MTEPKNNCVCISDLHLGAGFSLLSNPDCLQKLVTALHSYIPRVFGEERPPTLVLNGDILDFHFAPMDSIIEAFQQFFRALFDRQRPPLFAPEVIYLPGNHDHRIWEQMKDVALIRRRRHPGISGHNLTTDLFEDTIDVDHSLGSYLLNEVLSECDQIYPCHISLRYPNWGLRSARHKRQVLFHHGHYVEGIYRAMSTFSEALREHLIDDIEELEAQNGAWVDFLWSSFSSSELHVNNIVSLYSISQDTAATQLGCRKLARKICAYLDKHYSVSSSTRLGGVMSLEKLITVMLGATLGKIFQSERADYQEKLGASSVEGLRWYLSGPLRRQMQDTEFKRADGQLGERIEHCHFIFGHTHKPFQSRLPVPGFARNVDIFNSGGWVLGEYEFTSVQGAAIIFVDRALHVASLRLFDAPVNEDDSNGVQLPRVRVEDVNGWHGDRAAASDGDNPLLLMMSRALAQPVCSSLFEAFNIAAERQARAVVKQREHLFFDPSRSPGVRSRLL